MDAPADSKAAATNVVIMVVLVEVLVLVLVEVLVLVLVLVTSISGLMMVRTGSAPLHSWLLERLHTAHLVELMMHVRGECGTLCSTPSISR